MGISNLKYVRINRIFIKFVFRELMRTLCAREKSVQWKSKEKNKERKIKMMGVSYKIIRGK